MLLLCAIATRAQSPVIGSSGADGALELTTPGVVVFGPDFFNARLNPSEDNVFHFTTIRIGKDVTVRLSSKHLTGPVFWLAQGPVQIDGTIELSGEDGSDWPSLAGAGGFPGGSPRKPGYGPEGFTLNAFLVPLVGGAGGPGGETQGGGAGGGALLIASRTSITINGKIIASGGATSGGSGGNGGAIRVVAAVIEGAGTLSAKGGEPGGTDGVIRFESDDNRFAGKMDAAHVYYGKPLGLFLPPTPQPSVRVITVDGASVTAPEFTMKQPFSVQIAIEGRNIPLGTTVDLQCFSPNGVAQSVTTSPLVGTADRSSATALISLPAGATRCLAVVTSSRSH
jgi:hypothetical protein